MYGGNLETAIQKKHFERKPEIIYDIIIQIARALVYLHGQNLFLIAKILHKSLLRLWILIKKIRIGTLLSSLKLQSQCQYI